MLTRLLRWRAGAQVSEATDARLRRARRAEMEVVMPALLQWLT